MAFRILLIDDHQIVRDGLRLLLRNEPDLELVGSAYDSESGWQAVQEQRPDLIIMDMNVPGEGGAALTERVHGAFPTIKVVVLSAHAEAKYVQAALAAGAIGYVLKGNGFLVLRDAIRAALIGRTYLCPDATTVLVRQVQQPLCGVQSNGAVLSIREVEVLRQLADGGSTKEIAFNLGVSAKTVETHRSNLMGKLGLRSIAELTKYAVREGLTQL